MSKPRGTGSKSSFADADALCALGAAAFACGLPEGMAQTLKDRFPVLMTVVVYPPNKNLFMSIYECVMCLNDAGGWTRERIADWVSTFEPSPVEILELAPPSVPIYEESQDEVVA